VSEPLVNSTVVSGRARRSRWSAMLRLVLEFTLIFAGTMLAKQILAATVNASYPNLLWLPVIVLTLQRGLAAGLAAAIIAAALQYSGGLPGALMSEDVYAYIGRIAAEPVGWTAVALLIGHIRSRQIASTAELQAQLAERSQHCAAVADLCVDLRRRTEMLERHIAANAHSSNADMAQAMSDLHHAGWDDFVQRLTRFVVLMTGSAEFTVYLLRDDALKFAFQPIDDHRPGADVPIVREDPLFAAIVNEQRTLSAARPADRALLAGRSIMAGPLMEGKAPDRVIGMFAIGGVSLDDCPDDIERRFSLTCSELSRLVGRISLVERWHSAGASKSNGHKPAENETSDATPRVDGESVPIPPQAAHKHQLTLQ
jgi:GAF domain